LEAMQQKEFVNQCDRLCGDGDYTISVETIVEWTSEEASCVCVSTPVNLKILREMKFR